MEKYPFFMSNFLPIYEHLAYMRMECTTLFWYSCKYRNKDEEEFCIVLWQLKKFVRTCHKSIIPNAISISNGYYFKYDCVKKKNKNSHFILIGNWPLEMCMQGSMIFQHLSHPLIIYILLVSPPCVFDRRIICDCTQWYVEQIQMSCFLKNVLEIGFPDYYLVGK